VPQQWLKVRADNHQGQESTNHCLQHLQRWHLMPQHQQDQVIVMLEKAERHLLDGCAGDELLLIALLLVAVVVMLAAVVVGLLAGCWLAAFAGKGSAAAARGPAPAAAHAAAGLPLAVVCADQSGAELLVAAVAPSPQQGNLQQVHLHVTQCNIGGDQEA